MKNYRNTCLIGILLLLFFASSMPLFAQMPNKPLSVGIIPKPEKTTIHEGYIVLDKQTPISIAAPFKSLNSYFQQSLFEVTAIRYPIASKKASAKAKTSISVVRDKSIQNKEGYRLHIDGQRIKIMASEKGGVVYALQTLRQLIHLNNPLWGHRYVMLPQVDIVDTPQYAWRGFMLLARFLI